MARIVVDDDGCWVWQGARQTSGYGNTSFSPEPGVRKALLVHRVTWEHFEGPVPRDMELDHLCGQRACCNPGHLEVVTHTDNLNRSEAVTAARFRNLALAAPKRWLVSA